MIQGLLKLGALRALKWPLAAVRLATWRIVPVLTLSL